MKINHYIMFTLLLASMYVRAEVIALSASQQKNMGIVVAPVVSSNATQAKRYSAEVLIPTAQERLISTPQQGLVEAMYVAVGDQVQKGQLLARVTSPDLVLLQRDYVQADIQKQLAEKSVARDEALFKEGIIPERRLLETKSQYALASAQVAQTKQSLRLAGVSDKNVAKMSSAKGMQAGIAITAPISGQVLEQMVSVGQRLDSATPMYRIAQLDTLWLELSVPLTDMANVEIGSPVFVPSKQIAGKVVAILRSVNKANQTTKVRVAVTQGANALYPGELLQAELQTNVRAALQAFKLPKTALARNGQQVTVFKQVNTGYMPVVVTLLAEEGEFALVQGALNSQDKVAVKGIVALKGAVLGMGGE